jgi:8-amino-7-oxononanoate synthase
MEAIVRPQARPVSPDYDLSSFYHAAGDDPLNLVQPFAAWYRKARPNGYYLYQEAIGSAPTTHVRVKHGKTGRWHDLLNLASYNYLGLSYRPEVRAAAIDAIQKYGLGASGSPITSGTFDIHEELADELARFKGREACLLFPSGYSANVGFISGLMRSGDVIFLDQYAHASLVDGAILAKSKAVFFRHNSARDLERKLAQEHGKKLVVVEGVYSMDGDVCALPEILDVATRHRARLLIDEAHSSFLFGPNGRGIAEHFGVDRDVDFHVGTFSKSLGGQGGFVAGSKALIDYISAFGRAIFFSCNLAPVLAAGLLAALRLAAAEPELRTRLWDNVAFLHRRLAEEGIDTGKSTTKIIPVMINGDARVFAVAEKLQERGLFLNPARYPAVPKHRSRLRISVSAAHTPEELETAVQTIAGVLREEGIRS